MHSLHVESGFLCRVFMVIDIISQEKGGQDMKALPVFTENSPLYQMLVSESAFRNRVWASDALRRSRIEKRYGVDSEPRQERKHK